MEYDYIVVGSGVAGLYFSLKSAGHSVLLITKAKLKDSNTYYAQGGVAAVIDKKNDTFKKHAEDTICAGAGINDKKIVWQHVKEAPKIIDDLIKIGVEFNREKNGDLRLTKEGCHSVNRIAHAHDNTGEAIENTLIKAIKKCQNVTIKENCIAVDIIRKKGITQGVIVLENKEVYPVFGKAVILATGSLSQMYSHNTNPDISTGDGIAIAKRANAHLKDMEFVQFHPTNLHYDGEPFLISEALRGEGGKLVNDTGEAFMKKYHKMGDLAPRDVVSRSIVTEMEKSKKDFVFLDMRHLDADFLRKRFPNIYKKCKKEGIDITKNKIPVSPAAHYMCGGIKVDKHGRTSVKGLYAIGEVACTGLNGGNRLASNSIIEGMIFAEQALIDSEKYIKKIKYFDRTLTIPELTFIRDEPAEMTSNLRGIMWQKVGICRHEKELWSALNDVNAIRTEFDTKYYRKVNRQILELRNMLINAREIIKSAIKRKKSVGCHFIS